MEQPQYLSFRGEYDDSVEVEGWLREEYKTTKATFLIGCEETGGCLVTIAYTKRGTWKGTVEQIAEDVPIPWAVEVKTGAPHGGAISKRRCGYSVVVVVHAPAGSQGRTLRTRPLATKRPKGK